MGELGDVIERLAATIEARRGADVSQSWSARLIGDPALAAKKLAEEAVEAALAAVQGDKAGVIAESADVIYHLLALLAATSTSAVIKWTTDQTSSSQVSYGTTTAYGIAITPRTAVGLRVPTTRSHRTPSSGD